jgi:hypothetical protein
VRRPHLVLPHLGHHHRVAFRDAVQFLDHELWVDFLGTAGVLKRVLFLPLRALRDPLRVFLLFDEGEELFEDLAAIAHQRDIDRNGLGNGRGVNVNVDDVLAARGELREFPRHAVVEASADGDDAVGLVHGPVGILGSVHAEHVEGVGVIFGKGPCPASGRAGI